MIGGNTKSRLRKNARISSKNSTTQENIRISRLKTKLRNLYKKEKFKSEIKPIIENLSDELYQLENEHAKVAKLHVNILLRPKGEKCSKTYLIVLEGQYAKSNNF